MRAFLIASAGENPTACALCIIGYDASIWNRWSESSAVTDALQSLSKFSARCQFPVGELHWVQCTGGSSGDLYLIKSVTCTLCVKLRMFAYLHKVIRSVNCNQSKLMMAFRLFFQRLNKKFIYGKYLSNATPDPTGLYIFSTLQFQTLMLCFTFFLFETCSMMFVWWWSLTNLWGLWRRVVFILLYYYCIY